METTTSPLYVPTSWGTLRVTDVLTTRTKSLMQLTLVFLYCCLNRPKHQSGKNLVYPTGRKLILISVWRPVSTLHIR